MSSVILARRAQRSNGRQRWLDHLESVQTHEPRCNEFRRHSQDSKDDVGRKCSSLQRKKYTNHDVHRTVRRYLFEPSEILSQLISNRSTEQVLRTEFGEPSGTQYKDVSKRILTAIEFLYIVVVV